jgi:hypothetical protein
VEIILGLLIQKLTANKVEYGDCQMKEITTEAHQELRQKMW